MEPLDYRRIADTVASQIAVGALPIGERLKPQRDFAAEMGIATSTASRVYAELKRRGLVSGEVGRGTYVLGSKPPPEPSTRPAMINCVWNFPVLACEGKLVSECLAQYVRSPSLVDAFLGPLGANGDNNHRAGAVRLLTRTGWVPNPASILFAGNGRQAVAACFSAFGRPGTRIGLETFTYPSAAHMAKRMSFVPVPLRMDEDGLLPDSIEEAVTNGGLDLVYVQPTLHNPLGMTMSLQRRKAVAKTLIRHGIIGIEDAVYTFLDTEAPLPLAALAPDNVVYVDSLTKRIAPAVTLGFLVTPVRLFDRLKAELSGSAWNPTGLMADLATRLIMDGVLDELERSKRKDAAARQLRAAKILSELKVETNPSSYHLWLKLPPHWRVEAFIAASARRGVAITPGSAFSSDPGLSVNAVRLALASPPLPDLDTALSTVSALARLPRETVVTE